MHGRRLEAATDDLEQSFAAIRERKELRYVARSRHRATTGGRNRLGACRRTELVRCNQNVRDPRLLLRRAKVLRGKLRGSEDRRSPDSVGRSQASGAMASEPEATRKEDLA